MNLSRKVPLAFAMALLLTLAAGLGGLWAVGRSLDIFHAEVQQQVAHERAVAAIAQHFKTQVQEWKNVLLRGADAAALDKHWTAFVQEEKAVADGAAWLRSDLGETHLQALLDRFLTAHRKMASGYREGLEKFKAAGQQPQAGDQAVRGADREPSQLLEALEREIATLSAATASNAYAAGQRAAGWSLALMLLAALLGVIIGVLLSRAVVRPLMHAIDMAAEVARGNLARTIRAAGRDELARLLQALAHMQGQLRQLVSEVRGNAEGVAMASAEIAQGNSDLAARTEAQAAALQQTASSVGQLSETLRGNAEHAKQASQLAQVANEVAERGGQAVGQVVQTMQDIAGDSHRIADVTGVIDAIAFQTNILALNAAVEAAKVGEHGRGFAVVASEVRGLAQRSADAAREIKQLIQASAERVARGDAQASQAGATMNEVVGAIHRVTALVAEISRASDAQSSSLYQVSEAIDRMDQGTQQNSALVEETSAAAESLKGQADQLVATVGVFKLA